MSPDSAPRPTPDLGAVATRFALDADAMAKLRELTGIIAADAGAPTTLHEPERIIADHLLDSLVALELEGVADWGAPRLADLGAGAGFPGLPLAIARPGASVALVESNTRKTEFLRGVVRRLELDNVEVVRSRAEQWRDGIGVCDVVVARALAAPAVVAEYAAPLLRDGGTLLAWRGRRDAVEEAAAGVAAIELGLRFLAPVAVAPYPGALHRHIHPAVKVAPTPARFPRRPGVARKHPLGAAGAPRNG